MSRARGPAGRKKRGVALVLAIFFMILLALIAITLIGMVPVELKTATRTKLDLQAHYCATAGIRRARTWAQAVMTPETNPSSPDNLGDSSSWNNTYCNYLNEICSVPTSNADWQAMPLTNLGTSGLIPTVSTRWGNDSYKMLNIPATGNGSVAGATVVTVSKAPLTMGDWKVYTVIIPDADSPGGANTLNGTGQVVRAFGGAGNSGQRCFQMVTIAYFQGYPVVRAKSVFLESSFARYSLFVNADPENTWYLTATAGQQSTEGPVHTNGFFRFAGMDNSLWDYTGSIIPFNSMMTFASRPGSAAYAGMDYDGALYYQGNDQNGQDPNKRPFGGPSESARYSKMISNGRGNLRQTASPIALPQNTSKISDAAYGTTNGQTYSTAMYGDAAIASHINSEGIFVMGKGAGGTQAAGGVVIKGNQQRMFLEAIGTNGLPYGVTGTESSSLASGSASLANPGIRVQASTAITKELYSTWSSSTSTPTASNRTSITESVTPTSRSYSRYSTGQNLRYTTSYPGTWGTTTLNGGGAAGGVEVTSNFTTTATSSWVTGTDTLWSTSSTPWNSTSTSWGSWTTSYRQFETTLSSVTASASWKPQDQVIETKNSAITLSPASFVASQSRFLNSAGAQGTGNQMEKSSVSNSVSGATNEILGYTQFIIKDGSAAAATLTTGATTISQDRVVLIKQSRTDPRTAIVEVFSRGSGSAASGDPVLNGAVFTEGNIGGMAGINIQRKTIAGQIEQTGTTNSSDPLGPQPARPSATLNVGNNLWQYGTNPRDTDPNVARKPAGADHGLGLVAEWINVNARPGNFSGYDSGLLTSNSQVLTIYATMLAGRKSGTSSIGGFTVGVTAPQTVRNNINYSTMGNSNTRPMIRTVGGQIVANYYARLSLANSAGWSSSAFYDQQLALKPPPFFPNDGGLNPLTYVEERVGNAQNF